MEHIFDNRHVLQSFRVQGGYTVSTSPSNKKYTISYEEAKEFFLKNLSELEFQKIREYLRPKTKMHNEEIILWCVEVIENTLTNSRCFDLNRSSCRTSLRELFMERIAVSGSAYAILFLKKHFYQENKRIVILNNSRNTLLKAA